MSKHRLDPRRYTGSPDDDLDDDDLDDEKPVNRKYRDGGEKSNKPHKKPDRRPRRPDHLED